MSGRSVLGRPRRTKVYDCNYTAGERYYKPVVDSLDRKTRPTGGISSPDTFQTLRSALAAEEAEIPTFRRQTSRPDEEFDFEEPRRNANTALLGEFDSIFENRNRAFRGEKSPNRNIRTLEDEADQEISSYVKRVRETRPARLTLEDEFEDEATLRGSKRRQVVDFQEKLLNSVGVKNSDIDKARLAIEDDPFFKKRTLRVTAEDDEAAPSLTKWTALNRRSILDGESEDSGSAAARARKTRSRLLDLDTEMEELAGRSAAREKRVAQLRALVKENEANAAESTAASSRVVQRATVRTEKKTVTF
ncbi:hypothetical protein Cfor_03985 [Coptotermes formosanus]|uniref:Uncharacterized protein n=1 Tax=Coptotermes formosanus TaxID=36987 RepID=A0A6L2PUV2_COPFO|nr:hypothetical protein Cfor_04101 [Coptotermes formosanus]GFG36296.1 hypothetical protein Cfor_03985 [Coptotermes formosanus]